MTDSSAKESYQRCYLVTSHDSQQTYPVFHPWRPNSTSKAAAVLHQSPALPRLWASGSVAATLARLCSSQLLLHLWGTTLLEMLAALGYVKQRKEHFHLTAMTRLALPEITPAIPLPPSAARMLDVDWVIGCRPQVGNLGVDELGIGYDLLLLFNIRLAPK